ncbi:MAG TPA: site-specific integrase [Pyrinomonadaceae bacterium]|jgi:integrase
MTVEKRGSFYHYEFMEGGKRYYGCFNGKGGKPVARDKKEAKELEFKERLKVRNGPLFVEQERERLKDFATFVDEVYLPFARENHAHSDHAEFRCGVLKESFAGKRFDEITMMSVVGYINERLRSDTVRKEVLEDGTKLSRKRSPTTVNKEVTLLSSIFIMAIRERVTHSNPCDELPKSVRSKIPARRKRNRVLSADEEHRLFGEGLTGRREHLREPVEVALYTGMRRGEVLGLKPEHVNLERVPRSFVVKGEAWVIRPGWLLIEKSKNGKPRTIPMSGRVRRVIEQLCAEATLGGYVFESIRTGRKITDVKRGFTSACAEAGIENLTFHDLRHTWSTRAAEMGVPEHVRRDIMGHSSQSMTGDYTHATPEAMEEAMERVAGYSVNYGKITAKARRRQGLR